MARDPQMRHYDGADVLTDKVRKMASASLPTPTIVVEGKTHEMPTHGEVTLIFHDGHLKYIHRLSKEKVE